MAAVGCGEKAIGCVLRITDTLGLRPDTRIALTTTAIGGRAGQLTVGLDGGADCVTVGA
jgi:hypothetical protein